jgi:hypothetical protein
MADSLPEQGSSTSKTFRAGKRSRAKLESVDSLTGNLPHGGAGFSSRQSSPSWKGNAQLRQKAPEAIATTLTKASR